MIHEFEKQSMRMRVSEEVIRRILAKRGLALTNHDFHVLGITIRTYSHMISAWIREALNSPFIEHVSPFSSGTSCLSHGGLEPSRHSFREWEFSQAKLYRFGIYR